MLVIAFAFLLATVNCNVIGRHGPEDPLIRARREVHGSSYLNFDGSSGANVKMPLAGNDKTMVSAIGGLNLDSTGQLSSSSVGLALDNVRGDGLSLTETRIPDFGKQLTAAGKLNLVNNDNHNLNANAFITKNMPEFPEVPNFNTVGGSVDYMYKNKIGASLGVSNTPYFHRTDYSANGNLNLFRGSDSSLDFNAGYHKSVSPFMKSSWEPNFGLTFRKYF